MMDHPGLNKYPSRYKCGAYIIRYVVEGSPYYVIIDDKFTHKYGRCQNPKEIWVKVLEKAYAKMYGGYANIKGGWP